jgi:adenine-specific DNA glycosylase
LRLGVARDGALVCTRVFPRCFSSPLPPEERGGQREKERERETETERKEEEEETYVIKDPKRQARSLPRRPALGDWTGEERGHTKRAQQEGSGNNNPSRCLPKVPSATPAGYKNSEATHIARACAMCLASDCCGSRELSWGKRWKLRAWEE